MFHKIASVESEASYQFCKSRVTELELTGQKSTYVFVVEKSSSSIVHHFFFFFFVQILSCFMQRS